MRKNGWKYQNIIDINKPMDYACLEENIREMERIFKSTKSIERVIIGKSYLGKNINLIKIGDGAHKVIYIGAHHAMEWLTSIILMRFAEDFCKSYIFNEKMYAYDPEYVLQARTVYIVPMLNPDGVDLAIHGLEVDNPVRSRLIQMNKGSEDFSKWQANARGVDLNHNYDADFNLLKEIEMQSGITEPCATRYGGEYPESEPEVASLASLIRSDTDISVLVALHTQGEEIYWRYKDIIPPKAKMLANLIKKATGYELEYPGEDIASYGGCKDWFISTFNRPGFTIECGKGKNPLPISDFVTIYNYIAEALMLLAMN
ncbi:MAG: M14 family metallocarboxypeptidase [Oscillospiraceae bacterium]|nr:M14 family metallocarboxypeptidase [Oscillospiraceae bacterium]